MLDFAKVLGQVDALVEEQVRALARLDRAADQAGHAMRAAAPDTASLANRVAHLPSSRLFAVPMEPVDLVRAAPPVPDPHTVVAVDGSQIEPDRHQAALCYMLNVGAITLRYGTGEPAILESHPTLHYRDEDLLDEQEGDSQLIAPRRVATRRLERECEVLEELIRRAASPLPGARTIPRPRTSGGRGHTGATGHPPANSGGLRCPVVALMDGTLILWTLEAETAELRASVLDAFNRLLETGRKHRVPVLGYISRPGSRDVINLLRAHLCGMEEARCALKCTAISRAGAPCAALEDITDRVAYARWLGPSPGHEGLVALNRVHQPSTGVPSPATGPRGWDNHQPVLSDGRRGAVFGSRSKVLKELPSHDGICFFYLNTGHEIARVELPKWVAEDEELLDLAHAVAFDQAARKGGGYPRALTEAHERAVIRGADRAALFRLLETSLARAHVTVATTRKSLSKRTRSV